ncbi:hypothetical protein QM012_007350 [Aureobasidium pullulans]|uniref:RNA-dependent RNA polymerase n=1 Tax=Aureobasidium pullulans TaxID=5580 RepID=A0ABR0TMQ7_AURPU
MPIFQLPAVVLFLKHNRHIATVANDYPTRTVWSTVRHTSFQRLHEKLTAEAPYTALPFDVKFQVLRFARNGVLAPKKVVDMLPTITLLAANHDVSVIIESLRHLYQGLEPIGPHSEAENYAVESITNNLLDFAQKHGNSRSQNLYALANRHSHIVLVHRLTVTVAGLYLEGPEPEVSNRVLRKYKDHPDHFVRVTFADEDDLGDFGHIHTAARCAARIGQAFTDTTGTVEVEAEMQMGIRDVERNGRCFSDGCGKISLELLKKVWLLYGLGNPVVLQIRQAGIKGVVSLDSRLLEDQFCKVVMQHADHTLWCSTVSSSFLAFLPLRLEDLGVPLESFMTLQDEEVERLRMMTTNTFNASLLLGGTQTSKAAKLSGFLEMLADIGLEYHDDSFLRGVVEMAVLTKLRKLKYRARIPVWNAVTLYGIMDETEYLKEGQIYAVTQSSLNERREVLTRNKVIITRSPALHPGDIRIVEAIDVPENSPLEHLRNCVVFSQHGNCDLPSQLSGGDLDGDKFNVIFEPLLMPQRDISPPAAYPRLPDRDLGREVTIQDMSSFFVEFMKIDHLGTICHRHLQIADQKPNGVFDPDCITLASMASAAVDYSKTGVSVSLDLAPRAPSAKPDFMAPSPRVILEADGFASLEDIAQREEEDDTDPIADLDDLRTVRYYRSEKALGHLYRAIDEQEYLASLQDATKPEPDQDYTVLPALWAYIHHYTKGIQWEHHLDLARQIRDGYEHTLLQFLHSFSINPLRRLAIP